MPIDSGNLALKGLDYLFSTEENRQEEQREQVQQIPIDELHPFTNHPFKVLDDEAMTRTVESIAQYGVLAPLIARPRPEGGYEIISGHRRKHAAELAHLDTVPVIVRNMKDDAATILMVDSNLQREHILPSERAFAYKMKLDAIKNQGARSDLTSRQVVGKLEAADEVGKATDESGRQVQRFIRLTNLVPELLDMVDEKKISFNPAVELSYLDAKQQQDFLEAMSKKLDHIDDAVTGFFSIMHMAMKNELGSAEPYFAATSPVLDLTVIRPDDAPHILACFDEADEGIGISENEPLGFRYNPKQVVKLMGQRYLVGPVIFHRFDEDGNFASLTMGDMYTIQKYLETKSVTLMIDRDKLTCICID